MNGRPRSSGGSTGLLTLGRFLKARFPWSVRRLPVHAGLGCPHRDAATGAGGCAFCRPAAFADLAAAGLSTGGQMAAGIARARARGYAGRFMAYYQSGSNTFAPTDDLRRLWAPVLDFPDDVVALAVGTRPDCLEDGALDLLGGFAGRMMTWLELGLPSASDETLRLVGRGHDVACFEDAVRRARRRPGLLLCAHVILGLPGEGPAEMRRTFLELARLGLDGIKIHQLQVIRGTEMERMHARGLVRPLGEREYEDLLCALLPLLPAGVVVHRLAAEARDDLLVGPRWAGPKTALQARVERRLAAGA